LTRAAANAEGKSLALTIAEYAGVVLDLFELYDIEVGIKELRQAASRATYAGEDAHENLEQADEDIYNAVAGAVATIDEKIQGYEKSLRFTNLNEQYGRYQELSGVLARIKRKVAKAGEKREQRDRLYRYITDGADFKAALNYFDELRGSIGAIRKSVRRRNGRWVLSVSATAALILITSFSLASMFVAG